MEQADKRNASVSIPSRRVGDVQVNCKGRETCNVSIPSRRVGDLVELVREGLLEVSFHPLKAGRRLCSQNATKLVAVVSIPSRRVGDFVLTPDGLIYVGVSIPSRRVGDTLEDW